MDSEKLLPKEHRLQTFFEEMGDEVRLELDDTARSQDGNLLSVDIEFDSYQRLQALASIAYALENRVIKQGDMRVYQAMYRAVVFSYQVSEMVYGDSVPLDVGVYLKTVADKHDGYEIFEHNVRDYLADNPAVAQLLESYIDDIDEGRAYHEAAELAGGMMFMLAERGLAEQFIIEESQNASIDRFKAQD
jgi:hypothetical protein